MGSRRSHEVVPSVSRRGVVPWAVCQDVELVPSGDLKRNMEQDLRGRSERARIPLMAERHPLTPLPRDMEWGCCAA